MSEFEMRPDEFRRHGYQVIDWIAAYLANASTMPVVPDLKPGEILDSLPRSAPDEPEQMEDLLADFRSQIVPGLTLWNHPRFHAFFANSSAGAAILGEALTAAVNTNGMLWKSAPAHVELEQLVCSWLRQWLGLSDEFFGEILDTASTATMQAIAAARVAADPELRTRGARPGMVVYCSEYAHSSIEKGALSLGVGQDNVRKIGVDAEYRMVPDLLRSAIATDRERGLMPFCVVSTIGTTAVTSIDPVSAIQDVCDAERLWHHIDAAYAGPATILEEHRWMMEGANRADSLVTNPHKWLFTPMDCSLFYCRRPDVLREAFSLVPSYLRTEANDRAVNFMDYGFALGRRFRALKLWFVMRYFGRKRVEQIIREHIALAQQFAQLVRADKRFEIVAPAPLSLVCFRYRGTDDDNRALIDRVNASGYAFLAGAVLDGQFIIRYAIGNLATTENDVRGLWTKLQQLAATLHD